MTASPTRHGLVAITLSAALLLTACQGTAPADDGPSTGGEPTGVFPVTIETAYGDLTVEEAPERIIALGPQHLDILGSIDVAPIASNAYVATEAELVESYPWLEGVDHGELDTALVGADFAASLEAIAKHEPDLILASTWVVDEDLYEQISQIAPTYVGRVLGNNDWDVQLEDIGALTGQTAAATAARERVDVAYASARDQLPALDGLTYSMLRFDGDGFGIGNGSWFEGLGLVPASYQNNTQTTENISLENIAQLDSDVMSIWFWQGSYDELAADPRFQELPAVVNNAVIDVDLSLANATNSAGPLSLVYAIDRVVPLLLESNYG